MRLFGYKCPVTSRSERTDWNTILKERMGKKVDFERQSVSGTFWEKGDKVREQYLGRLW